MGYTMLHNERIGRKHYAVNSLEGAALAFIRESCEKLRFDRDKSMFFTNDNLDFEGGSIKKNQIPFNMEKDIDRLCFENVIERFMKSGKKEDAFDIYFCYLEMFVGDYKKTRRMIELLSEFEANGSGLLMKHRDHYSHSAYVFVLGLAIYQSNKTFREHYKKCYKIQDEYEAAAHYLQYWGLTSLFHDIGYPFELPFEQVCSYFEVEGSKREENPFVAYQSLEKFAEIDEVTKEALKSYVKEKECSTIPEVFAYILTQKLGKEYGFSETQMGEWITKKPIYPDKFGYFMDHAYFSAVVLFKKLFGEMKCQLNAEYLDALTAILMHNSLYKFCIAHYKEEGNKPFKAELHPLAYMLMLCDELQCWDRTSYGRNSKTELHPMGCIFDFKNETIKASYLFDEKEIGKINHFKDSYIEWLQNDGDENTQPKLKAYSEFYVKKNGISKFQAEIEKIVDLTTIKLVVDSGITANIRKGNGSYLSNSNFMNLYNFAIVLNGRWENENWKAAKKAGRIEGFLNDQKMMEQFVQSFKGLSLEYKLSNINQAKAFAGYLNEIGCFYTDKEVDFEQVENFSEEELLKIGILEHQRWLQEHYDMGWTYGTPEKQERDFVRQHKDMIPGMSKTEVEVTMKEAKENYERLEKAEQDKDTEPMECMLAMLKMFDGLRIYRLN